MNGDIRFTMANTNLPNYYENFQGLDGVIRSATLTGNATAKRQVLAADYGLTWQATKTFALSEQIDFSNAHQPGITNSLGSALNTPATVVAGEQWPLRRSTTRILRVPRFPGSLHDGSCFQYYRQYQSAQRMPTLASRS